MRNCASYRDPRFNSEMDKKSGYSTRSILCICIMGAHEKPMAAVVAPGAARHAEARQGGAAVPMEAGAVVPK